MLIATDNDITSSTKHTLVFHMPTFPHWPLADVQNLANFQDFQQPSCVSPKMHLNIKKTILLNFFIFHLHFEILLFSKCQGLQKCTGDWPLYERYRILGNNKVNTMLADALIPRHARPSAATVLHKDFREVLVLEYLHHLHVKIWLYTTVKPLI